MSPTWERHQTYRQVMADCLAENSPYEKLNLKEIKLSQISDTPTLC